MERQRESCQIEIITYLKSKGDIYLKLTIAIHRIVFNTVLLLLLFFQSGCGDSKNIRIIRLGHGLDQTHSVHLAMEYMAERVRERSGGTIQIDIYPSEQLGTERQCLELLQIGSLGMTKVSASIMESFVPAFQVYSLPYLFTDDAHRFRVLESEIGEELLVSAEEFWIRGLCYYDSGWRSFYTKNRVINHPDDLRGLKIRTQESPTSVRMVNALGGSATPISWGELYTALQQGVVDGAENNPPSFYRSRHYEVCSYYILNEHTAVPDVLVISTHVWNALTAAEQEIVRESALESFHYQKELWENDTQHALERLKEEGIEIIIPDKKPFREIAENIYDDYKGTPTFELIEKIRSF